MTNLYRIGKIILLFCAGVVIVYFVAFFALPAYAALFHSHQSFADAFPIDRAEMSPDAITVTISEPDFARYPVLRELLENPTGGHVTFDRFLYRDQQRIEEFRNTYCVNRPVNRYVHWNNTYYQIVIGQE